MIKENAMALQRFNPPGMLNDLQTDTSRQAWSDEVIHRFFTSEIASVKGCVGNNKVQFIDPLVRDLGNDRRQVSWPAFPIALLKTMTRQKALEAADNPATGRRVQDEYLEWFIHRDAAGEITAIDFTCEGPEYWSFLSRNLSKKEFVELYKIANPAATEQALFDAAGDYKPKNEFNTSNGIMHLIHPANTLGAEIDIVAQSTMHRNKSQVVNCRRCHSGDAIGDGNRKSDPTIASNVNQLALDGRAITIADPVGLYINRLDTTGWVTPDGSNPQGLFKITRGTPGVRARFEVPGNKFKISQVKIGNEPIRFAGQVAEHVFIQVTAIVGPKNEFKQEPVIPCTGALPLMGAIAESVSALPSRTHS
jgi:hypothetical protein